MKKNLKLMALGLAVLCNLAQAQQGGTLKKIKDTGTIIFGVREASMPFAYSDGKGSFHGYSIDLCNRIAAAVQKQLGMPNLKIDMKPITSAVRMQSIAGGAIDMECASTTNNLERQKQVAFSPTIFVSSSRILTKKSSGISTLADLKGKTITSTAGTSNMKQLEALNAERRLGMTILGVKNGAEAIPMIESGKAAAYIMDDITLAALAANSGNSAEYVISREALSVEPFGIMLRKEDADLKKIVDETITGLFRSGEINRIYAKWFQSPIPPKGINLNWPITSSLASAIAKSTDSGDPATYAPVPESQKK